MKTLVYPFDRQFLPIVRHGMHPNELEFCFFVSPNGWGYNDKDIGTLDLAGELGLTISRDFDASLDRTECALFVPSDKNLDHEKSIFPRVLQAIGSGKHIHCAIELSSMEYETLREACEKQNKNFVYYSSNLDHYLVEDYVSKNKFTSLVEIDVPVIMVMGVMEQVSKFETQLCLHNYMSGLGYKVSHVTSRSYGSITGAHSAPNFLFNSSFSETEKILAFNHYVKHIEYNEHPDLIIIGVPGGIIPVDNKIYNGFGMTAFEITQAVTPDATIVCVPFDKYNREYFQRLDTLLQIRFSSLNNSYLVDNIIFDRSSQPVPGQYSMLLIDDNAESEQFRNVGYPVARKEHRNKFLEHILDTLAENAKYSVH